MSLVDIFKSIRPVNSNKIARTLNYDNQIPKIARLVDSSEPVFLVSSSKPVRLVDVHLHSVNSNKSFCLINFNKPVHPIDVGKSVRLVNSSKIVNSVEVCKLVNPVVVCKPICDIRKPFFVNNCRHLILDLILSFSLCPQILVFLIESLYI